MKQTFHLFAGMNLTAVQLISPIISVSQQGGICNTNAAASYFAQK